MANIIWQVGNSGDERVTAKALQSKSEATLYTTTELAEMNEPFKSIKITDKLTIVADFSFLTGKAGKLSPAGMAEFLVLSGLEYVGTISLCICNSAVECPALGYKTFMEALRQELISMAMANDASLYVGTIVGRLGYVNVYNAQLAESNINEIIVKHFKESGRGKPKIGSKYVHTEPTLLAKDNKFLDKGENKKGTAGIAVMDGVNVGEG